MADDIDKEGGPGGGYPEGINDLYVANNVVISGSMPKPHDPMDFDSETSWQTVNSPMSPTQSDDSILQNLIQAADNAERIGQIPLTQNLTTSHSLPSLPQNQQRPVHPPNPSAPLTNSSLASEPTTRSTPKRRINEIQDDQEARDDLAKSPKIPHKSPQVPPPELPKVDRPELKYSRSNQGPFEVLVQRDFSHPDNKSLHPLTISRLVRLILKSQNRQHELGEVKRVGAKIQLTLKSRDTAKSLIGNVVFKE